MPNTSNRDEFTPATKRAIERQARGHCSNPMCRRLTSGAKSDGTGEINVGEAAHIRAAAPGGERYDPTMTTVERRAATNGIWLCGVCAHAVDSKDSKFTVEQLSEWKRRTDEDSWRSVIHNVPYGPGMTAPAPDELRDRLREAATADLAVFRHTARWPRSGVSLTLKVARVDEPLNTRALANAVTTFDDLILVAAPGMGKTTTIFQIADGVLETGNGTPLVVPLGDWATDQDGLLVSILKRPAFARISEPDFRSVASKPGVVLLLDGWNELNATARERARVQLTSLKAELPDLGLVFSTRKQGLDIPFAGTQVDLLPLGDEQQIAIARAMRGEVGERLVDQAWRTPGVRDLVTIPLYLTALLSLPEGTPFPATKEEVLRRFIAAQEQEAGHLAALQAVTGGFQHSYLNRLAIFMTAAANTSISDSDARRSISESTRLLVSDGQLNFATAQPDTLLDALVSNHVLIRSGDAAGYAFQHQQFQEWHASHHVEHMTLQAVSVTTDRERLKTDVLNDRSWTEAILFAVERMSRGDAAQKAACGSAILAAFEVDPMLAAEMIFRATDDTWSQVSANVCVCVRRWHALGKVDRAVRFMITTGRPEFIDLLWPLLTHENDQVHLRALRAANRFRPSVFGNNAADRIAALPPAIRKSVLYEIASNSGMDGLDLATAIAKKDEDPEIKAFVTDALSFRRADRHVADLLRYADDAVYDVIVRAGHIDDTPDETVQARLKEARVRRRATGSTPRERLGAFLDGQRDENLDGEVAALVAALEIGRGSDGDPHVYELQKLYPQAFAEGLLQRVREDRPLFYRASDLLAAIGHSLEDTALLDITLEDSNLHNDRAEAAATVLGPKAVGKLIDAYLAAHDRLRNANGRYDEGLSHRSLALRNRIDQTPGRSLVSAVRLRADSATNSEIADLAELLCRESYANDARERPFKDEDLPSIAALAHKWGERLLMADDTTRSQKAAIATLISRHPSPVLLPILKRLLDDNLSRYQAFRNTAAASGWRDTAAMHEAHHPHTYEYQRAFVAIRARDTDLMMAGYLTNEDFGPLAAGVLAVHWSEANEPKSERKVLGGPDFSRVESRHAARLTEPAKTCEEAELIFDAIAKLMGDGTTDKQKQLAVALGVIGARLPHGERSSTFQALLTLASREQRANLLLSLVMAGEEIDIQLVERGIQETFEAAKAQSWILQQNDAYQLRNWLRLLPFTTSVSEIPTIVRALPEAQRSPHILEELVSGLGTTTDSNSEEVLFKLAEGDARFYQDHRWRSTVLRLGTCSAARRLVDLIVSGAFDGKSRDQWHLRRELAGLISDHPEVRAYVRDLLRGAISQPLELLANAMSEKPDADDLRMLVEIERKTGRTFLSWRSIESVVTERVPSVGWEGAYNIVPVPAVGLRQRLLAMMSSSHADDPAARCLTAIDKIRDSHGAPETEPRHPDLISGRTWPILTPDPDVEDAA